MIRAVFFDLDDTLIDSAPAWEAALQAVFGAIQRVRPDMRYPDFLAVWDSAWRVLMRGVETGDLTLAETRDQRCRALLNALDLADEVSEASLSTLMEATYFHGLVAHPDAAVLSDLDRYTLGIITNGADDDHLDSQRSKLRKFGWNDLPVVLISDSFGVRKPDPRIVLAACELAGVVPEEAAFVGDSLSTDIPAGVGAGVFTVQIARHGRIPTEVSVRPDAVISSLFELPALLEAR